MTAPDLLGDDPLAPCPARPLWLITLADLALLLVGFMVLLHATSLDRRALANGLKAGFGVAAAAAKPDDAPMPVAAAAITNFAPGSAALPSSPAPLLAWAREALADPRVTLRVTGSVDGTPADVDPGSRTGTMLAIDRARATVAVLAPIAGPRLAVDTGKPGRRQVIVTLAFAGDR